MAARIVHFGADECSRLLVLAQRGYAMESCGTSVVRLQRLLKDTPADAVAVTQNGVRSVGHVATITRSMTPAPLILFDDLVGDYEPSQFDLIIPAYTAPTEWLARIAELIAKSHAIQDSSRLLRNQSHDLRRESTDVRKRSAAELERSRQLNNIE